ncbi:DUF3093 domain-containing protein [Agromyces seonyuensis]|uniref:DUF3093 family protein n=1 Tax=Agromyces seonyuensis TaxID=2662446 RepID=A0A6I4NT03_9MICO|nr:DUF3093 domain-containing protein [Agromyces seonyuensis]MWB97343.1 DUF3093 family protein [Agromyces seonyuensis]
MPYREKLVPTPWIFIATALLIPACILIFTPIALWLGIVIGILVYVITAVALWATSPVIEVGDGMLRAGAARIELAHVGEVAGFDGAAAIREKGTGLDARAYLVLRGWVHPVVRIPVVDEADPVPYWLVSTRRPNETAAAINGSRRPS